MSFELGSFRLGDIVTGQIVKLEPRGVLVDLGTGEPAFVPLSELSLAEIQTPEEALQLNEIREFVVIGNYDGEEDFFFSNCSPQTLDSARLYEAVQYRASLQCQHPVSREDLIVHTKILGTLSNGVSVKTQWFLSSKHSPTVTFSIRRLEMQKAWERIRQLQTEDVTLYLKVFQKTNHNAIVKIEGLRGVIDDVDRCGEKLKIGEKVPLNILEANEEFNRLRLIQLSTLIKLRQLQVGQVISSVVRRIKAYGVFVDIGGLYAFLPTEKIVPSVEHPEQIFKVNNSLKVTIAQIDIEKARVVLESGEKQT